MTKKQEESKLTTLNGTGNEMPNETNNALLNIGQLPTFPVIRDFVD